MRPPLQITWHEIPQSDALEADIRSRTEKLSQYHDKIINCHVVVSAPHRQHRRGNHYSLRIIINVPGKEIVVTRDPGDNNAHEDMYVTIRDAFNAARRQLQDYARVQQGDVKEHDIPMPGTISKTFPDEGYGFLLSPEGDEVYFHRNALRNGDFNKLMEGMDVRYVEEMGYEGPQAKQVTLPKH
ncbi:HPF/RaiA family ribosome-associated protein [Gilvimarinus sp. F26214L]|uniref:HPF/RaiA family ribosome-associated protein n=1 Tax=Gilvimarinus sp. DZF01 TaxID=3461371 RepID=UPI0040454742